MSASRSSNKGSHSFRMDRFDVDDLEEETRNLYLPRNLIQKSRHSNMEKNRSLQELDDAVASVTSGRRSSVGSTSSDRSFVSVSVDGSRSHGGESLEKKVIRHLTGSDFSYLAKAESNCGRSRCSTSSKSSWRSKTSKSSRSSKRSEAKERRRADRLERQVYQTIVNSGSTDISESSFSTKQCSDSACRSAQFILTDLFHEAARSMKENALPKLPSWSQLPASGPSLPATLQSRPPDYEQEYVVSTARCQANRSDQNCQYKQSGKGLDDLFSDMSLLAIGVGANNEAENDAFAPFPGESFQWEKEILPGRNVKQKYNMKEVSDVPGQYRSRSVDDDSLLQYSSTNGSSTFSQLSPTSPVSLCFVHTRASTLIQQDVEERFEANWTSFDGNPFKDADGFEDDFGFGIFPSVDRTVAQDSTQHNISSPSDEQDIDPAWDTSRLQLDSSPDSPSSVFNFCAGKDHSISKSKSDIVWNNSPDNKFDFSWGPDISRKFSC